MPSFPPPCFRRPAILRLCAVALAVHSLGACAQVAPAAAGVAGASADADPLAALLGTADAPPRPSASPAAPPAPASVDAAKPLPEPAARAAAATAPDPLSQLLQAQGSGASQASADAATPAGVAAGASAAPAVAAGSDAVAQPAPQPGPQPAQEAAQAADAASAAVAPAPPPPPPPPPVVLFPKRLGEFLPERPLPPPPPPAATVAVDPAAAATDPAAAGSPDRPAAASTAATTAPETDGAPVPAVAAGVPTAQDAAQAAAAGTGEVDTAPPVLRSQIPEQDPAEESVWRLSYSGRAAIEDGIATLHACAGGSLSTGIGHGLACKSTGQVNVKEALFSLDGGAQVEVVAKAKGTDVTTINGRPVAVDPYQLLPQIYTAVSGLSVLDGATMWAGRREESPFLMSSGLLPPNSPAMRFGVDNARFGDIGLNYQYTTRNDIGGQSLPSYHSVRTGPIATNEQGSVQLGFTHVEAQPLVQATGGAWWASAMHEQKGVLAGTNRLGLQFGEGARTAMTGYSGMGPALSRVRMAESLEWKRADGLGLAGSVESSLQFDRSPVGLLQWTATRVRPAYVASDRFKLAFEVAHDQISSGFGVAGQRTALTIAPTLTLGKGAGNANLRAFYTYSRATDVDGIAFTAPADAWTSQNSGSVFGIQLNRSW